MQDKQLRKPTQKSINCQKKQRLPKEDFLTLLRREELKRLDFNKAEYEYFVENCNFTERQKEILDLRRKGLSIIAITFRTNLSERTINREIRIIKNKILKVI